MPDRCEQPQYSPKVRCYLCVAIHIGFAGVHSDQVIEQMTGHVAASEAWGR